MGYTPALNKFNKLNYFNPLPNSPVPAKMSSGYEGTPMRLVPNKKDPMAGKT